MGSHAFRPSSSDEVDPDLRVTLDGLRQIVRQLRLSSSEAEGSLGVSGAQLFVLQQLAEGPASSIAALARRTATDPSSVSVLVRRLVERGFVVRRASKTDARRAEIVLSKRGEGIAKSMPPVTQTRLIEAFARLAPSARRSLAKGLSELVRGMGAYEKEPVLFFEEEEAASQKRGRKNRALS